MKNSIHKITVLFLIGILTINCSKDENEEIAIDNQEITGVWQVQSSEAFTNAAYFIFKDDNTFSILYQEEQGFRDKDSGNYSDDPANAQITMDFFGSNLVNYTLNNNDLTLLFSSGRAVSLTRSTTSPEEGWIIRLSALEEADSPWTEDVDIAWNGTHLLLGNGNEAEDIGLIDPESLALDGVLVTAERAFAVEVEKFDGPTRYIFQSDGGSPKFEFYREDTGNTTGESLEFGSWITGLASINETSIWVASDSEETLYLYDYFSNTIEKTLVLSDGRRPKGMAYHDGFLYLCSQGDLFKCDVSGTELAIVESYQLENRQIMGIAYDGSNFWAYAEQGNQGKIIKLNLSI